MARPATRCTPRVRATMSWLAAAASLALLSACGESPTAQIEVCPSDLRESMSPRDTAIAPGEQFTARLTLLGCYGTKVLSDTITYTSEDLSVAVVGTTTGIVTGVNPGTTRIRARSVHYHGNDTTHVVVR